MLTAKADTGVSLIWFPKHWGVQKSWQSRDLLAVNYLLLDFGRRDAAARSAQEQLLAANFLFNQKVQEVVFAVERAFYTLDAARASVKAAEVIVKMARTDRIAARKRLAVGLATKPQVLLSVQREAQAEYDLQNARLTVSDAQARLAVAAGVEANSAPDIESLESQPIPQALGQTVDELIKAALRQRPDLAAKVAAVRAAKADVDAARASLYPTVAASGYYGFNGFNYNLSNPPTPSYTAGVPDYAALVTLKWDLFTGFERLNSIRKAQAQREALRAELRALELDLVGEVWSAYYTFATALKKYDFAVALLASLAVGLRFKSEIVPERTGDNPRSVVLRARSRQRALCADPEQSRCLDFGGGGCLRNRRDAGAGAALRMRWR